jgi:hypothetical protein
MVFVVCRADQYEEKGIHELIACFESKSDADRMSKFMNLEDIYTQIKSYNGRKDMEAKFQVQQLKKMVEKYELSTNPRGSYIVVETPLMTVCIFRNETDVHELRNKILLAEV